jgi:hypothetical protein
MLCCAVRCCLVCVKIDGGPGPSWGAWDAERVSKGITRSAKRTVDGHRRYLNEYQLLAAYAISPATEVGNMSFSDAALASLNDNRRPYVVKENSSVWRLKQNLAQRGNQLTGIIVSHLDNDHYGGLLWMFQNLASQLQWLNGNTPIHRFVLGKNTKWTTTVQLAFLKGRSALPLLDPNNSTAETPGSLNTDTATVLISKTSSNAGGGLLVSYAPDWQRPITVISPLATMGLSSGDSDGNDEVQDATQSQQDEIKQVEEEKTVDVVGQPILAWTWSATKTTVAHKLGVPYWEPTVDNSVTNRNSVLTLYLAGTAGQDTAWKTANAALTGNTPLSWPSILFTGDSAAQEILSFKQEYVKKMVDCNKVAIMSTGSVTSMYLTILKVPHHGSVRNSFTESAFATQKTMLFSGNQTTDYQNVSTLLKGYLIYQCIQGATAATIIEASTAAAPAAASHARPFLPLLFPVADASVLSLLLCPTVAPSLLQRHGEQTYRDDLPTTNVSGPGEFAHAEVPDCEEYDR